MSTLAPDWAHQKSGVLLYAGGLSPNYVFDCHIHSHVGVITMPVMGGWIRGVGWSSSAAGVASSPLSSYTSCVVLYCL